MESIETRANGNGVVSLEHSLGADFANRKVKIIFEPIEEPQQVRGSRRHILELVSETKRLESLCGRLKAHGILLTTDDHRQPLGEGTDDAKEWTIRKFAKEHLRTNTDYESFNYDKFDKWWVPEQYKNPTWDLLSTCQIDDCAGLLIVEAKLCRSVNLTRVCSDQLTHYLERRNGTWFLFLFQVAVSGWGRPEI